MTNLINAQSTMLSQVASLEARTAERFARIEKEMKEGFDEIRTILVRHEHILQALSDSSRDIRERIGFKPHR